MVSFFPFFLKLNKEICKTTFSFFSLVRNVDGLSDKSGTIKETHEIRNY